MERAAFILVALFIPLELISIGFDIGATSRNHPDLSLVGVLWWNYFYFTNLTNLAVLFASLWMVYSRHTVSAAWAASLTLWMVIISTVYHVLLAPKVTDDFLLHYWLSNRVCHTIVPVLVLIWWVLMAPKNELRSKHAFWWLAYPVAYLIYAELRGIYIPLPGHAYPYFFLDLDKLGWEGVGRWVLIFTATFLIGGLVMVWLGRGLHRLGLTGVHRLDPDRTLSR